MGERDPLLDRRRGRETYTAPFTVTGEGEHSIAYFAIDAAGNAGRKTLTREKRHDRAGHDANAPTGGSRTRATVSLAPRTAPRA